MKTEFIFGYVPALWFSVFSSACFSSTGADVAAALAPAPEGERPKAEPKASAKLEEEQGVRPDREQPSTPKPPVSIHGIPRRPAPLRVPGFNPASHVGPMDGGVAPKPIVVVLHGNYDRPEWECEAWGVVAGFYGWILCPRGVKTPYATPAEDRWTYRGPGAVQKEIDAAVDALEKKYPGRVLREGTVLAGFSLGGIYAPGLALANPGRYPFLFLVEGGVKKLDPKKIGALKKAGVKGIGMAMSAPGRRSLAKGLMEHILRVDMKAVFVDMAGAGHAYRDDFPVTGREALRKLVEN